MTFKRENVLSEIIRKTKDIVYSLVDHDISKENARQIIEDRIYKIVKLQLDGELIITEEWLLDGKKG